MEKIALVTGSSRGIGRAVARRLAAEGYAVCVNYRVRQDCNKVARTVGDVQGDCKDKHNNLARFRGQSFIPVTDGGRSLIPGAEISRA